MPRNGNGTPGRTRNQFGTFGGVFTPSILTIFGVIMFLRAGFVVGQAGIGGALVILAIAEAIVLLTAVSLAAISTNTPILGGGAYYIISRVMGPQFGGSIGLALFFAQALSVPFYILGFTEALVQSFPALRALYAVIAFGTALVLFVITYVGAGWAIRTQYIVMTILGLGIVSFLGGSVLLFKHELLVANWAPAYTSHDYNLWRVFAIYFPAVTGIMAGVNMSGDLKDPAKSLVRGTFAAIIVGGAVYALEMLLCGGSQLRADLVNRPFEMLRQNALLGRGYFVMFGVFAATLSSAIGSFMGAPRVMQALARDRVLPLLRPLAAGTEKGNEPRRALWLTLGITAVVLAAATRNAGLEAFDIVAAIVTMFFLGTYGMVNLSAFVESFGLNPSFRPRFRLYHWSTALLGTLGCVAAMFLIDWAAASVAVVVIGILYVYVSRRAIRATYGDARRGFVYSLVRKNLWALGMFLAHPKNWRPTVLVLSGNPRTRLNLVRYGVWFGAGHGIVSMAEIVAGDFDDLLERRKAIVERAQKFVKDSGLNVYPEVIITHDFDEGVRVLLQSHSIGPIKPNTVLLGWPSGEDRVEPFVRHLRDIRRLGKSVVCVMDRGVPAPEVEKRIDLWWRGRENGSLMLILAHLLSRNAEWQGTRVRILREIEDEAGVRPSQEALAALAHAGRVEAEIAVHVSKEPFAEILPRYSTHASTIFLGFQPPEEAQAMAFYEYYNELLKKLPTAVLVSSNGEADLLA